MSYRDIIFPLFVFAIGATSSVVIWLGMTPDVAAEVGVSAFADTQKVLGAYTLSVVSFAVGCALAYRSADTQLPLRVPPLAAIKWARFLLVIGYGFWTILLLFSVSQGGIDLILNAVTGRGKLPSIPGVTTLVHASTAAAALWVVGGQDASDRRSVSRLAVPIGLLCLMRAFVGSERVAVYFPAVALASCWALQTKRSVGLSAVLSAAVLLFLVFAAFAGAEKFRSFAAKSEEYTVQDDLLAFSAKRLFVYYGAAVNTGGGLLEFAAEEDDSEPIFLHTCSPLRQIIDAVNGFEAQGLGRFLESSGLYNPEFNNAWGIAAPLSEGVVWGCAYWVLWGFVSTRLYRRAIQPDTDPFSLAMFGVVTAGLVDAARVNCLGTVHILLPLGLLWLGRRLALARA